jgi:hypothetical protein
MKKILQLAVTALFVCTVAFSLPLWAKMGEAIVDEAKVSLTTPASVSLIPCDTKTVSEEVLCLTLQHRFNGGRPEKIEKIAIPFEQVDKNPLVLLAELKKHFSRLVKKHNKPLEIKTVLDFWWPPKLLRDLGKWPSVSIETVVDSQGQGKSEVNFPAYRREVPAKSGKGLLDWKGLTAQFTFTEQSDNLTLALKSGGLMFKKPGELMLSVGETGFNGVFDANLEPTFVDLNLPSFVQNDDEGKMTLNDLVFNLKIGKSPQGG